MDLLTAIEGLIILIAFFYLVNMVSHIRNIQRTLMYILVVDKLDSEIGWSEGMFDNMRRMGVITKTQETALKSRLEKR